MLALHSSRRWTFGTPLPLATLALTMLAVNARHIFVGCRSSTICRAMLSQFDHLVGASGRRVAEGQPALGQSYSRMAAQRESKLTKLMVLRFFSRKSEVNILECAQW